MILFNEMGLRPEIQKAIESMGFEVPTPIQEKVIPYILESNTDVVALAQTGTGKTAAFGLPIIQQIDTTSKKTQALVLSPTRELALQIAKDLENYAKHIPQMQIAVVYGGADIQKQIKQLDKGV